jgi:dephospho-CoA kinase
MRFVVRPHVLMADFDITSQTQSPPRRVHFVGLTGGLGAGKSEALRALDELGAAMLSTDAVEAERAEFVVRNNGTLAELKQALSRVLATVGES